MSTRYGHYALIVHLHPVSGFLPAFQYPVHVKDLKLIFNMVLCCSSASSSMKSLGPNERGHPQGSSLKAKMKTVIKQHKKITTDGLLVSGSIGLTFSSISEALSLAGMFFLLAGIAVFIYFLVKGKSLEEISGMFEREGMVAGSPEFVELSSSTAVTALKYEDVGSGSGWEP
ncbi:hypothetical protein SELMODRAFT_418551 [Selaginella moellendorffii]|uniref:Uncharacterized protein n=1 Tax=Selaginella moellendorffii TaxID=88036 RepID=D8S626_SELML|nr:hypothetical protein SELMODRAFT_418551 [Selaginella moellendorffii]